MYLPRAIFENKNHNIEHDTYYILFETILISSVLDATDF